MNFSYIASITGYSDPADLCWDILLAALPNRAMAIFFFISEDDMQKYAKQTWVSFGSDAAANFGDGIDGLGLPHPRRYDSLSRK